MARVYVVTEGQYSNNHVVGVFSSREKALEICPAANGKGLYVRIDEYQLDTLDDGEVLVEVFQIWIEAKTGAIARQESEVKVLPGNWTYVKYESYADRVYAESAVSAEHALKLAIEFRQNMVSNVTA